MTHQSPKPDGRYAKTFATDRQIDDDWDEITAVETPRAIKSEPPERRKRSGEYGLVRLEEPDADR